MPSTQPTSSRKNGQEWRFPEQVVFFIKLDRDKIYNVVDIEIDGGCGKERRASGGGRRGGGRYGGVGRHGKLGEGPVARYHENLGENSTLRLVFSLTYIDYTIYREAEIN